MTEKDSFGLRLTLGLAVIGQLLVLLGIAGLLRASVLVVLLVVAVAVPRFLGSSESLGVGVWAGVAALTTPFVLLALFPPIAFDETLYHLPFVQALARDGSITFLGHLRFPAFPMLQELLCVPVFLALGDTATHFVSLAEGILLAALLLHSTPGDRRAGLLAASLCLGHPIVVQLATVNHVEIALTLFIAAGIICLDRIEVGDPSRYAAMAGFFLGTACCVKYLGGYFALAGLAYLLLFGPNRKRTVPIFLGALAIAVLPAYGKIVQLTGNPVHPFLTSVFGANEWVLPGSPMLSPSERVIAGVRLFWDVTFARQRLNQQPPWSPLFAVAFALMLLAATRNRRTAFAAAVCAGYISIFTYLPPDSRYLVPLLPLVSMVAARVIAAWLRSQPRANAIAAALALLAIAPAFAYAGYRLMKQGLPPVTAAQRIAYLEERIPEYRAFRRRAPGPAYQCGAEHLQAFGDPLMGDLAGLTPYAKILGESGNAADLARALERIGARDLLVSRARCPETWQELPREPYFRLIYSDDGGALWRVNASPRPTGDSVR